VPSFGTACLFFVSCETNLPRQTVWRSADDRNIPVFSHGLSRRNIVFSSPLFRSRRARVHVRRLPEFIARGASLRHFGKNNRGILSGDIPAGLKQIMETAKRKSDSACFPSGIPCSLAWQVNSQNFSEAFSVFPTRRECCAVSGKENNSEGSDSCRVMRLEPGHVSVGKKNKQD
jgi:hypothetical protein